jgi:hypothetical protein
MVLTISKEGNQFVVDETSRTGSPRVGRGRTMKEAIGDFIHGNQAELGIHLIVAMSAEPAEQRRRKRELAKR